MFFSPFNPRNNLKNKSQTASFRRPGMLNTSSVLLLSKTNGPSNFYLTRKTLTSFSSLAAWGKS